MREIAYDLLEGTIKFFLMIYVSTSDNLIINKDNIEENDFNVMLNKVEEETKDIMEILNERLEMKSELLAEILSKERNH